MKSLLRYLSPFAPDLAGAVSALFEFGGMIVICDAGGCTGNVCGFDEPRWFSRKSALFSAGLRDMDAILGRDDRLVAKLAVATAGSQLHFAALIGSPVPAVIATDFKALKRMAEARTHLPVLALEASGTHDYDEGAAAAWLELFRMFAVETLPVVPKTVGILGATPLDFSCLDAGMRIADALHGLDAALEVRCYGMGAGLDEVRRASEVEKNLVVAPSGMAVAWDLKRRFGTPYEIRCPYLPPATVGQLAALKGAAKVLVIHQQFAANALRDALRSIAPGVRATVGTWFQFDAAAGCAGDFKVGGEDEFAAAVARGNFDAVIADRCLRRALGDFHGTWVDFPHFAISGRLADESGDGAAL